MFLEGARWDFKKHIINNPYPKELFSDLPMILLYPIEDREPPVEGIYNCPLYKVESRRGTLSTTGHSTNFVMYM
jgi:dynein heavy chain